MTSQTVLIAAFSGRALAQSARRAGYVPLVVDAFGDLDMRAAAHAYRTIPDAMRTGFRAKPVLTALDDLVAASPSRPIGLVLGSGFEDKPRLWDILDKRYGVLGCNAETVRMCKDPRTFFPLLDQLGIAHPQTQMQPPEDASGWLTKQIGGSGGRHIRLATASSEAKPQRYFQRRLKGERISFSAVVADGIASDVTRQWSSPSPTEPMRYGGSVSLIWSGSPQELTMLYAVSELAGAFRLRGLVSFDFIVNGGDVSLLEINPRAGASLDAVDTIDGSRFKAHVMACHNGKLHYGTNTENHESRAAAILHADRGPLTLGKFDWPEWTADQGAPGTHVPLHAPLATILAEAATPDAAEALARARLAELETLIYETSKS